MIATSVTKKILHWCGALLLVMSFVVLSYSPAILPNQIKSAEATEPVIDYLAIATEIYNAVESWVIAAAQKFYLWYLQYKESVLDGLAWTVINVILEKMAQEIVKWINSGFKGRPAFVQNPEAFFIDIADRVVGDTIWGSDFKFLCSPFALDIKLALELQYVNSRGPDYKYTSQCTLSNVIKNVDGFFAGDFISSGWEGWMEVTTKPQNNPFGALALGSMHLNAEIGSKQDKKEQELSWGRGLMSSKVCNNVEDGLGGQMEECNYVTPGAAIQDQLSRTLSIPVERLTVADEFNEILNALFNQLVIKAFSEAGGLLGSTESNISGAPGTGSYFNDLSNATRPISSTELESMTKAVAAENTYLALIVGLLNTVNAAADYKNNTYGVDASCHSGTLSPTLAAIKSDLDIKVLEIQLTIARIEAMIKEYTDLENNLALTKQERLERQLALVQEFSAMQADLHDETSVAILKVRDAKNIEDAIAAFKAEVDAACIYIIYTNPSDGA